MSQNLDSQIALRMHLIRRKRIYQRARAILKEFGRLEVEERSDCVCEKARLTVAFKDAFLLIESHSFGQFHENNQIDIWFNEQYVFSATDTAWTKNIDSRRLMKVSKQTIVIELFLSGDWMAYLNTRQIRAVFNFKSKKEKAELPKKAREADFELARRFGLE